MPYRGSEPDAALARAREYLEGVADQLRTRAKVADLYVEAGRPTATIARYAGEAGVDLIVTATHGYGGVARLVLGSVATGTLQRAHVPLMLVRPAAMRRPAPAPVAAPGEPAAAVPVAAAPEEPAGPPVTLTLAPTERELVREALEFLLSSTQYEEHLARPLHELLSKLRQAEPAAGPGQRDGSPATASP